MVLATEIISQRFTSMSTSTLKIGHLILCALNHFVLVTLGAPGERKHQNHDHRYSQDPTQMPTLRFKCASVTKLCPHQTAY